MSEDVNRAVALGYFDGLHLGHRAVLAQALSAREKGLRPAVLLFDRPPAEAVSGVKVPRLITDADRRERLAGMGFELCGAVFDELRELPPEAFVQTVLRDRLRARLVACGYNYTFGRGGAGDAKLLRTLCEKYGIETAVSAPVLYAGGEISSSRIRRDIAAGHMAAAAEMLGGGLRFTAPVFRGDGRGRLLDAPTANQYLPEGFIIPKHGVYAAYAETDGKVYPAVTNVGVRPTFHGDSLRCETFLIGFSGDLYGKALTLRLMELLREERVFPDADALRAQIALDREEALRRLDTRFTKRLLFPS